MYPELNYTSNISKDSFGSFPMTFMRALHKPSNKTNSKGKVRTGVGQVQKATNKLTIKSSIYFGCREEVERVTPDWKGEGAGLQSSM